MAKYDYLIVGAGLTGAVFAEQAQKHGKTALVIDRREHIGGNLFTEKTNGINVHKYGAHIFHTNNDEVWEYVNRFAKFNNFINSPIAFCSGEIYQLPFNMHTFYKLWKVVKPIEAQKILEKQREEITGIPENLEEQAIKLVGRDVYEKLIKGYTEKQWGRDCKELPAFIIKRIPVRLTYDSNYFEAKHQGIPIDGYSDMLERMICPNADCWLGVDFKENQHDFAKIADTIIYTGAIDEYFDYKYGALEYRSLRFEHKFLTTDNFQGNAVVNYTDRETPWTRIIEHKWFNFGKDEDGNAISHTIITKEYSKEWNPGEEPYYPINNEKNDKTYRQYMENAQKDAKNVIFAGRLGEYKYYDMDIAIEKALEKAKTLFREGNE